MPKNARASLIAALLLLALSAGRANAADVCVTIDEARDTFSPSDRTAALLVLARQFELNGEHVVPPGCPTPYVVSHVQLGTTIMITLSGPNGQRDATARGMDDVPAVYSQMVRSLLRGVPMDARDVTDRTNVSATQGATPRRIQADSLFYARLGYSALFGNRTYNGPSAGYIGYRRELDTFGIDVSFFNFQFKSSDRPYGSAGGTSGMTGTWLKLEVLHFASPTSDRSPYVGGGLSWSTVNLNQTVDTGNRSWDGNGLQGELTAGYELGRASAIRVFFQADAGLPFYRLESTTYTYAYQYPYSPPTTSTGHRYVPSLTLSMGLGWQRGAK